MHGSNEDRPDVAIFLLTLLGRFGIFLSHLLGVFVVYHLLILVTHGVTHHFLFFIGAMHVHVLTDLAQPRIFEPLIWHPKEALSKPE